MLILIQKPYQLLNISQIYKYIFLHYDIISYESHNDKILDFKLKLV